MIMKEEGTLTASQSMDSVNTVPDDEPVGFVTFTSRILAETAKQDLQGVKFDPDLPQTIRLEFAKSNTKVSKPKQQSPPAAALPTFFHPFTGQEIINPFMHANGGGVADLLHAGALPAYATELAAPATALAAAHPLFGAVPVNLAAAFAPEHHHMNGHMHTLTSLAAHPALLAAGLPAMIHAQHAQMPVAHHQSPMMASPLAAHLPLPLSSPCSTLFVANLGPMVNEQELKEVFSSFPGFCRLRLHNKNGSPVAFVEYQDVRHAVQALNSLQGFILLSSDRGGIRIEFARNKMGEPKKDENFNNQSPVSV